MYLQCQLKQFTYYNYTTKYFSLFHFHHTKTFQVDSITFHIHFSPTRVPTISKRNSELESSALVMNYPTGTY